jgi:hypothetical protein
LYCYINSISQALETQGESQMQIEKGLVKQLARAQKHGVEVPAEAIRWGQHHVRGWVDAALKQRGERLDQ